MALGTKVDIRWLKVNLTYYIKFLSGEEKIRQVQTCDKSHQNQFIHTEHFTMETIRNLRTLSSKDNWIMTIDISDVCLTIPLDEEFKDDVAFQYQDQTY